MAYGNTMVLVLYKTSYIINWTSKIVSIFNSVYIEITMGTQLELRISILAI